MEIEFFTTSSGEKPARDFLDELSPKMRAKMLDKIRYLHELGQAEGNISRILYFFVIGDKAVLTHGFIKKTQNTPPKEIKKAEKYRRQYLSQHRGDEKHG